MTLNNVPKIKPPKVQEVNVKQSKYEVVGKTLPTRAIVCAPSGSGKTVLPSIFFDIYIYSGCFSRVYIFHLVFQ